MTSRFPTEAGGWREDCRQGRGCGKCHSDICRPRGVLPNVKVAPSASNGSPEESPGGQKYLGVSTERGQDSHGSV